MKRTRIDILILLAALPLAACQKYLDKEPDNRTHITTPEQIAQLLTSAYPKANYIMFCESMSDNAEDKEGGGSGYEFVDQINRQSYRFEVVEVSPDSEDSPTFYWNACYKAIAAANQALEIIRTMPDQNQVAPHRGEALLARAYAHFMLVTLFSKVYDPQTAASDPGIPYVTEPEKQLLVQYERRTVAYVYEMIEKDILEGYPLISDHIYGSSPRFHFNKKAASAFLARFYLFKRDYPLVITYASEALGNIVTDNLRPWNTILTNLQYAELQADYTRSSTLGNLLLQETGSIWGRTYPSLRYGLGDRVANAVLIRPNVTGARYAYPLYGATPRSYNIPKFFEHFVRESLNASTGRVFNTVPLLTAEEALLNRAEAYIMTNNTTAALNDMNAFLSKNIDEYNEATDRVTTSKILNFYGSPVQLGALNAILDFKRAFFLHEGMRWFDILRLKLPVVHTTREGETIVLEPEDNRRVLQLPALTRQAGLEPNPR